MRKSRKPGDFTGLADDYSKYRPDYCPSVLSALLGMLEKPISGIDFVDVGAGTGIWTRMVYTAGVNSVVAVEPNKDMRNYGMMETRRKSVRWVDGSAEMTSLPDGSADWITMASSFHWADFEQATKEFHRVLRPRGRFSALWNPRLFELNPILLEIEGHLNTLNPDINRVSSGLSGITETLSLRLLDSPFFEDVIYLEGRHTVNMSPERYIGAWRSVNDLQVQLGKEKFNKFLNFIEQKIVGLNEIEATYLTRAWSARRSD